MNFFQENLDIVFFIYGVAFMAMGVAILTQPREASGFRLANIFWLLALFGLVHGLNEFLDMWAIIKGRHPALDLVRWFALVISYIFLFEFGRRLFCLTRPGSPPYQKNIARLLSWWITPVTGIIIFTAGSVSHDFWKTGNIWARYLLGFPGGLLTGLGFLLYYKSRRETLQPLSARKIFVVGGMSFLVYGALGGLIVPEGGFFPSSIINTDSFLSTLKAPVQVFRAACAISAAWAVAGILKIFNYEMRGKLQAAQRQLEGQSDMNLRLTENLGSLFDISKDILTEFDTKTLLTKIADDACRLIGCRYSAIGILNDKGGYEYFVFSGISPEKSGHIIGEHGMPEGKGLLGYPLKINRPLRVDNISGHPFFRGFPDGHPEMKTFLGVPVALHNKVVGGLYFADKDFQPVAGAGQGRGVEEFTEEDERLATSLGAIVSLAINNVMMLKEIRNLASFPQKSPYPVMECNMDLGITYVNPAARGLINELGIRGHEILPPGIHETAAAPDSFNKGISYHEVKFGGMAFGEYSHFVPDKKTVRIYLYDITEQKLAEAEIKRNYMTQKVLNSLLQLSLENISLNELLNRGLDIILSIPFLTPKKGGIFLVKDEPEVLALAVNRYLPPPQQKVCSRVPFGRCLCGEAASSGRIQFANSLDERHEGCYEGISPHGHYIVPLLSKYKVMGVITLFLEEMHRQEKWEVEFLQAAADTLAGAIESKNAEKRLKESYKQLRNLTGHLQSVREEERGRIARDIHDELGQLMTALKIDLAWLHSRLHRDQEVFLDKIKSMIELIEMGNKTIQRISSELRPRMLDDLGLSAAIEWQAREFQERTGIECGVRMIPEDIILEKELATNIFRIFQEAITNVIRHADATRVEVNLKVDPSGLELLITDNGKGIVEEQISSPYSCGLISMRERVLPWDGRVEITGEENRGTTVKVNVQVNARTS
ncbi:MAG: GAF domain-containing protein [Nitrospiraceae bacterium]|nr:MAG: GAF domain-containing protein [Nitrospiraceae bacterium]